MITEEEAKKLAKLSRLEIEDSELKKISTEIDSILDYIDKIKTAKTGEVTDKIKKPEVRNIVREDENPHDKGIYTKKILDNAPEVEDDQIKVKKIL